MERSSEGISMHSYRPQSDRFTLYLGGIPVGLDYASLDLPLSRAFQVTEKAELRSLAEGFNLI